ncbi:endonuclease NucS domain-containing protein [Rhizobium sp. CNPSo 4039]|uniref:endonuclease NucS domain-containing protein n=1 Tax=Rhizobium sp. CNPSo 4039 TaxID=3021409 RepID=UPI00254BE763|nr:endonuclease NucS domain-containing protein [Rhizobium sp. CNPSo 4039]MDK4711589.1 endonuclease NucS [Rhizobium sp. CNPSo 4039]
MVQRHCVVIPKEDGGLEVYPLKNWLRQNPQYLPADLDATRSTSHQLRSALKQAGWTMQETLDEVRMIFPGQSSNIDVVEELLGGVEDTVVGDESSPYFSLEYQLRDFLAANLGSIDFGGKKLRLYVDPTGRDGIEYPSAVGPIDILAVDEHGAFFIFELKRAQSADRALGQIARYMGWVKQTIGHDNDVSGIIISKSVSRNLKYARTVMPNVYLYEYAVSFTVTPAHDIEPSI